jgi:hypothetical protein
VPLRQTVAELRPKIELVVYDFIILYSREKKNKRKEKKKQRKECNGF